jgi:hypothetical protein
MEMVRIYSMVLSLLSPVLLLSCSAAPKKGWDQSAHQIPFEEVKAKASRSGVIVTQTAQMARPVRISKSSPWLDQSITANYRGLNAKTAIRAILDQRPVRFEMNTSGPIVNALPDAATYREHLDAIAVQANWSYTVNRGVVAFSDWQVVNYSIDFILGNKQANLGIDGITTDQENTNSLDVANNNLDELTQIMERILDNTDAINNTQNKDDKKPRQPSFSVIKSTNSVLVSAPPNTQKQVQNALSAINSIAGKNIYLDFDIYTVDLKEQYQRAVDFEAFRDAGIKLTSSMTSDSDLSKQLPFILQLEFTEGNSFDNSKLLLKALATHGEATLFNQGSLLLKNNQVGNIQTSSLNRFVEIAVDNYQSETPAYKESVLQVLPSIVSDEINLHLALSNTDVEPYLKSLTREPMMMVNNGSNIQQTRTNVEIGSIRLGEQFVIPTQIKNGETLMLAGLTNKAYSNKQSQNQLIPTIGDGITRQQGQREIIIVMTAHLLD